MRDPAAPPSPTSIALHPHWYPALQLALAVGAWTVGVTGASHGALMAAPLAAGTALALHLLVSRRPRDELRIVISAMMIGLLADSLLAAAGLVVAAPFSDVVAPLWQLALWTLPASALHTYLRWMTARRALATACAAGAAALGCLVEQRLGALRFPAGPFAALGACALSWALAMPLLLSWCARIDRQARGAGDAALPAQPQ